MNQNDMERLMASLREGYEPLGKKGELQPYSPWTISDFAMVVKRFMKFVRDGNTDREKRREKAKGRA